VGAEPAVDPVAPPTLVALPPLPAAVTVAAPGVERTAPEDIALEMVQPEAAHVESSTAEVEPAPVEDHQPEPEHDPEPIPEPRQRPTRSLLIPEENVA
jgi:hypothetical protein